MKQKYEYSLPTTSVWGSFDSGELWAKDKDEARELAEDLINNDILGINEALKNTDLSIDVDTDEVEVKLVFDLDSELTKLYEDFHGMEFNGLLFNNDIDREVFLTHPNLSDDIIYCVPFWDDNDRGINFAYGEDDDDDGVGDIVKHYVTVPCKLPTNKEEFEEFKIFYRGQLMTAVSKFATVDNVVLNREKKEYTVEGFLIPKQTIKFHDYSDWDSINDVTGNCVFDCQIDMEEYDDSEHYEFQFTDLNYVEGDDHTGFNLDDTPKFGGGYINRDYKGVVVEFNKLEVEYSDLDKVIEIRGFKVGGVLYEVHIDATGGREIFDVFAEYGEVTDEIRAVLDKAVEKIEC
jgi:hypothetical protein